MQFISVHCAMSACCVGNSLAMVRQVAGGGRHVQSRRSFCLVFCTDVVEVVQDESVVVVSPCHPTPHKCL